VPDPEATAPGGKYPWPGEAGNDLQSKGSMAQIIRHQSLLSEDSHSMDIGGMKDMKTRFTVLVYMDIFGPIEPLKQKTISSQHF
jgi:hypothetical protein